jgi:hypothetical protein
VYDDTTGNPTTGRVVSEKNVNGGVMGVTA